MRVSQTVSEVKHPVSEWRTLIENKFAFDTAWPNEFYIFNSFGAFISHAAPGPMPNRNGRSRDDGRDDATNPAMAFAAMQ